MLASIKTAMQQRQSKKSCYVSCLMDVETKQHAYKKLLGVAGKEAQIEAKEQAVVVAQNAADIAKAQFERVSERLLTEFELFKNQKAIDIREVLCNFVDLQVLCNN